jgi:hypothetical protein
MGCRCYYPNNMELCPRFPSTPPGVFPHGGGRFFNGAMQTDDRSAFRTSGRRNPLPKDSDFMPSWATDEAEHRRRVRQALLRVL